MVSGNVGDQRPHGSGLKVMCIKVKCHMGQGPPKGHAHDRWAHVNVKFLNFFFHNSV